MPGRGPCLSSIWCKENTKYLLKEVQRTGPMSKDHPFSEQAASFLCSRAHCALEERPVHAQAWERQFRDLSTHTDPALSSDHVAKQGMRQMWRTHGWSKPQGV